MVIAMVILAKRGSPIKKWECSRPSTPGARIRRSSARVPSSSGRWQSASDVCCGFKIGNHGSSWRGPF